MDRQEAVGQGLSMNWPARFARRTELMQRSAVRELLKVTGRPGMISFAGGLPAAELFPVEALEAATQRVFASRARPALQYGETEGVPGLRDWIADRFSSASNPLTRDHVLITAGAQQALDLLARVLVNDETPVIVENPTYLAFLSAWRPFGARFIPVAVDNDGLQVDQVEALPESESRLLYTIPDFQNPSGVSLSHERRRQLIEVADRRQTLIVEDVAYRALRFEGDELPSLMDLASGRGSAQVVQLGTFSKTLAPGLRIGWVLGEPQLIDKLVLAKQAADLHTSTFNQHVVLEAVSSGLLEEHLPRLKSAYRERCDAMLSSLRDCFPAKASWTQPTGGLFVFVTLPEGVSVRKLLAEAIEQNVAFVPGDEFFCDHQGSSTLRLNFSHSAPTVIREGIQRLGALLEK